MLQALLHGKLDRWLIKDAVAIEDLLTSVVLGSACYAPAERALLPFLSKAIDERGQLLGTHLSNVTSVTAEFWPNWSASEVMSCEGKSDSPATDEGGERGPGSITIPRSQPEVVLDITHGDGRHQLILIEAKLHSGKSSHASGNGFVTDQLAKYWLHLRQVAKRRSADALAVVYLTKGSRRPDDDLAASQRDLQAAGCPRAPLYWLSWRELVGVVDLKEAPRILHDCVKLLCEQWQLVKVEMGAWPELPPLPPPFVFAQRFHWAMPTPLPRRWSFDEGIEP